LNSDLLKKYSVERKLINHEPVYLTSSMNKTMKMADDAKKLRIARLIDQCINMLLAVKRKSRLSTALETIEMFLKRPVIQEQIEKSVSCKKGCSACCYMHVDIVDSEAKKLAKKYKDFLLQKKGELIKQSELSDEDKQKPRRCVFLNNWNECDIYGDRPISCRKYFVQSDPKYCDLNHYEYEKHITHSYEALEAIETAFYQLEKAGSLPKMILKYL
jgi:Fe-S-cluster containining protein